MFPRGNRKQDFDELPETYTIFITENNQFKDGKPYHRIERVDLDTEDHKLWDDGEHILYVNGAYQGDSDIGRLMHDFRCCDAKDMYFKEMKEITHHFKETKEGVEYMCRAFEETRNAAAYQNSIDVAVRMIQDGVLPLEKIAQYTGLPFDKVQELAGAKTA